MLKYALYRNRLTKKPNAYTAIPQAYEIKGIEDIIHQLTQPGSILKETECVAVINDFFKALSYQLKEGHGFACDYIRIHPKITGIFEGKEDVFDPERHQKQLSIVAMNALKDAMNELKLKKVEPIGSQAEIKSVYDLKSQQTDGVLSPGHLIEIHGRKLKLNTELADEGIFLINSADDSEIKITHLHTNHPGKLSAMLPDNLASGTYLLEVRNRPTRNKTLSAGVHMEHLSVS